jgi:hypothetical protein
MNVMRIAASVLVPAFALAAVALAGCSPNTDDAGPSVSTCRPVFFGVAGSGQGVQNPPPAVVPKTVSRADAHRYGSTVGLLKTDLSRLAGNELAAATAINYPATPVSQYIGPAGLITDLALSERKGVNSLVHAIRYSYRGGCAARPVLLAGYSQGAEVVIQAVDELTPRQQANVAVALFGNPSYLPGKPGDYPGGTTAGGIRPALQSGAYQLPADVRSARTIDVCAPGDGVCGIDPGRTTFVGRLSYVLAHTDAHRHAYAFGANGYVRRAAWFLWAHR